MESGAKPVQLASTVPEIDALTWRRLELAAFRGHHAVRYRLDPKARLRPRALRERAGMLVGLSIIAALFAPAAGMALLVPARISAAAEPDVGALLPASALCFLAFDIIVGVMLLEVLRDRGGSRFLQGLGVFGLVMAGIALLMVSAGDRAAAAQAGWAWLVPIVGTIILGVALIVTTAVFGVGPGTRGEPPAEDAPEEEWLRYSVGALHQRHRARARAELAEAVDELERRGLIDGAVAQRARATELGLLSLRMEQLA